jgi:uncharacterized membrane protein
VNIAQTLLLADSWGMHDGDVGMGWWIIGVPFMLLMIGGMMRGMGGGSSAPTESPGTTESPVEILKRRFAEGEIPLRSTARAARSSSMGLMSRTATTRTYR